MRRTLLMTMAPAVIASLLAFAAPKSVHATVVNIDVHYTYSGPGTGDNTVPVMTGDGALAGTGNFWNNAEGGTEMPSPAINPIPTTPPVYASDGSTVSPIAFSVGSDQGYVAGHGIPVLDTFASARWNFGSSTGQTPLQSWSLSNVPAGTYNLYLYADNGGYHNDATALTVNGYGTQSVNNTTDTSFIAGNNYVLFTGVSPVGGVISGTYSSNAYYLNSISQPNAGYGEGDFNGLQLISVVPEPSSLVLAGLAGLGLVFARRRMQKA